MFKRKQGLPSPVVSQNKAKERERRDTTNKRFYFLLIFTALSILFYKAINTIGSIDEDHFHHSTMIENKEFEDMDVLEVEERRSSFNPLRNEELRYANHIPRKNEDVAIPSSPPTHKDEEMEERENAPTALKAKPVEALKARTTANRDRSDYENLTIDFDDLNKYKIFGRIGSGKYSRVHWCSYANETRDCAVKFLRSIEAFRIRREVHILHHLQVCPNIVKLLGVVSAPKEVLSETLKLAKDARFKEGVRSNSEKQRIYKLMEDTSTTSGSENDFAFSTSYSSSDGDFAPSDEGTHKRIRQRLPPKGHRLGLVFEGVVGEYFRSMFAKFTLQDIIYYSRELLQAISCVHAQGIFHRDIKPENILIDPKRRVIKLADWGLAEYLLPDQDYSVRVATRYYKSPELLIDYKFYGSPLDMWSFGCVFAEMIFKKGTMFKGKDNKDQLVKIRKVLGDQPSFLRLLEKYKIEVKEEYQWVYEGRTWESYIDAHNEDTATPLAIDLLSKLLKYDPDERLTAEEALKHPFFK